MKKLIKKFKNSNLEDVGNFDPMFTDEDPDLIDSFDSKEKK